MNIIEFLVEIIKNVPNILQYFVPGIIFIMIIRIFSIKKFAENYTIIFSCVISYVFVSFVQTINELFIKEDVVKEPIVTSGIAVLFSLILGFWLALMFNSGWFKKITLKIFHKTLYDDIWQDVFDFKNGTNLKITIKDKPYYIIGHYRFSEEKGEESWMALSAYGKYSKEKNESIGQCYHDKENVIITIRMSDVEQIEVF